MNKAKVQSRHNILSFFFAALVSVTAAVICYKCDGADCKDRYRGEKEHEVVCGSDVLLKNDGGCSKYKTIGRFAGARVVRGIHTCNRACRQLFPLCNFSLEFPEILSQDYIRYH